MKKCNQKNCCCKCKYQLTLIESNIPNSYPMAFACIIPFITDKEPIAYFKISKHGSCEMFKRRE